MTEKHRNTPLNDRVEKVSSKHQQLLSPYPHCLLKEPFSYKFQTPKKIRSLLEVATWNGRQLMKVDRKKVA